MNSGIIYRCLIFMEIEKLACNCVVFFVAKYPNFV